MTRLEILLCTVAVVVAAVGFWMRTWSRRTVLRSVLVVSLGGAVLATYLLTCTPLSASFLGLGEGSAADAHTWRVLLAPLPGPDAAQAAYSDVEVLKFANGEWVFGISTDSHSSHWGGTVVVKDSTGRVRAFFGHVCGPNHLSRMAGAKSLAEFYDHEEWRHWKLREHAFE